ncbi:lipoprotein [Hydrogenophaga sp.]|uniref:LPS translocon maturation chaperone LptM n=1 Tax=Hydrogenophaga sp. TaxID=1904254 RepID=UPI0032C243D6
MVSILGRRTLTRRVSGMLVALLAAAALAACGQKGPLYLPEPAGSATGQATPVPDGQTADRPPRAR